MTPFDRLWEAIDLAEEDQTLPRDYPPEKRALSDSLDHWAQAIYKSGRTLRPDSRLSVLDIGPAALPISSEQAAQLARSDFFRPEIELHLLTEGGRLISDTFDRLLHILPLLVARPLTPFAERYLAHVARLYVWGFDDEVHALCRSVLDAAFQDLLPTEAVRSALGMKRNSPVTLALRLRLARFTSPRLLSDDLWRKAFFLKEDGNDVLHEDINHSLNFPTALEALGALVAVLGALPDPGSAVVVAPAPENAPWRPDSAV